MTSPTTDKDLVVGTPRRVTVVEPKVGDTADNFFEMKLLTPVMSENEQTGVVYRPSMHIFTSKELGRAVTRYSVEANYATENLNTTRIVTGYIGARTYKNKNDVLTTRFLIRFFDPDPNDLKHKTIFGLFTSRELRRSAERVRWYSNNPPFIMRLWRSFTGQNKK